MKGLTTFLRGIIGDRKRVDVDSLASAAMRSDSIDETGDDFREIAYLARTVNYLNGNDFYATGDRVYTHISAMSAEELKRKRDQLYDTAQSILGTVKQIDGQLSVLSDGTIHIPEPIAIYGEKK